MKADQPDLASYEIGDLLEFFQGPNDLYGRCDVCGRRTDNYGNCPMECYARINYGTSEDVSRE